MNLGFGVWKCSDVFERYLFIPSSVGEVGNLACLPFKYRSSKPVPNISEMHSLLILAKKDLTSPIGYVIIILTRSVSKISLQRYHTLVKQDMDKKLLTTLTSQYKESVRYNALHQDSLRAVVGSRAITIIIAIRRAVVG